MLRTRSAIALLALLVASATAGTLTPPAGPPAGTMKTLTEVEPRTPISAANTPGNPTAVYAIVLPGSYYLTGDVQGVGGKNGIEIRCSQVTLDLNGFTIRGVPQSGYGIGAIGQGFTGITVRNGNLIGWGDAGVQITPASGSRVERVSTEDCYIGIYAGDSTIVESCVTNNGFYGLSLGSNNAVRDCIASSNSSTGVYMYANKLSGVIERCVSNDNGAYGFYLTHQVQVIGCEARLNGLLGIITDGASTIRDCRVDSNTNGGIRPGNGSVVSGNACASNGDFGIQVGLECDVFGNNCRYTTNNPTAAGIWVSAPGDGRNLIHDNTLTSNSIGLEVDGARNAIYSNHATLNVMNFDIALNNRMGAVVVPPLSGAVSGNAGGAGSGATDPWANFAY